MDSDLVAWVGSPAWWLEVPGYFQAQPDRLLSCMTQMRLNHPGSDNCGRQGTS